MDAANEVGQTSIWDVYASVVVVAGIVVGPLATELAIRQNVKRRSEFSPATRR